MPVPYPGRASLLPLAETSELQDGHRLVKVFGRLSWKYTSPVAFGPAQAEQTERHVPGGMGRR